jgi:hypothetical protein
VKRLAGLALALSLIGACTGEEPAFSSTATRQIITEAREDGLNVDPYDLNQDVDNAIDITINLGSCGLDATAIVVYKQDNIIDVKDYGFTRNGTTYTFQNLQELESNILGPQPCKTLVQQNG